MPQSHKTISVIYHPFLWIFRRSLLRLRILVSNSPVTSRSQSDWVTDSGCRFLDVGFRCLDRERYISTTLEEYYVIKLKIIGYLLITLLTLVSRTKPQSWLTDHKTRVFECVSFSRTVICSPVWAIHEPLTDCWWISAWGTTPYGPHEVKMYFVKGMKCGQRDLIHLFKKLY